VVEWQSNLRSHRGRLVSGPGSGPGTQVHAASYLRERRIVLDRALLAHHNELARILTHEMFHFVWLRLGNPLRLSWQKLLHSEMQSRARGELGWSAELRKDKLDPTRLDLRTRSWRDYACESFCDTAARLYSGSRNHPEFTLAQRFVAARREWFADLVRYREGGLRI